MAQANPIALQRTLESFKGVVDEVVFGDVLIFPHHRKIIESYQFDYNLRIIKLPFNYIFQMGFSSVLNYLVSNAKNDLCLYMNCSEIILENYGINEIVESNPDCNSFYFSHAVEKHRWFRCNDRRFLKWDGRIHEEPIGDSKPYHKPIFQMADTEKDIDNQFESAVANTVKEMTYWRQLIAIVDKPSEKGITNDWWYNFAKDGYDSMKERLAKKGKQYTAFQLGDFEMFWNEIHTTDYFNKEKFESNDLINFQGNRKIVL